jgi:hypothetical protein
MKKLIIPFILFLLITGSGFAQEKIWQVGLFSFFDNIEFGGSNVKVPQTMAGVIFAPEAGLRFDSVHRIGVGVNLMHEFGSKTVVKSIYPTAYYNYSKGSLRFLMGAFPRYTSIDKYPRVFFQDSLYYYRPNVEGMFVELTREWGYVNLWLDWTGRQSVEVHESFLTGISGRYDRGIFYLRNFGYLYHFARKKDPVIDEAFHDNLLFYTSLGIDLSGRTFLEVLDLNAGWVAGLERARAENTGWIKLHGMLLEARAEYRNIGLFNTFYSGEGLMYFYGDHGTDLYWGDPAYRAKSYNRTDMYIRVFKEKRLNLELIWSLHFLESRVYHEQILRVKVDLNNL